MRGKVMAIPRPCRSRSVAVALFLAILVMPAAAQQITRIAVIDMSRVLSAFSRDTAGLKNFEQKKAEIQAEVDRMAAEIKSLQTKKGEAQSKGDSDLARSLESEITKKTTDLKEYVSARQNELDIMAKALSSSASFLQKINATIAQVAESEGYSIVLNLKPQDQNANIVLWNSTAIDITDKVIQALSQNQ
ncbi:MAG: OmpH family outer membrane protein [Spirochaetaceae bacterium]|nr:OmpH family outer membrane protein [Spirochaetaceae bacterium]